MRLLLLLLIAASSRFLHAQTVDRYLIVPASGSIEAVRSAVEAQGGAVEAVHGEYLLVTAPSAVVERLRSNAGVRLLQRVADGRVSTMERIAASSETVATSSSTSLTWESGEYRYDGMGNIATVGSAAIPGADGHRVYGYDRAQRLTHAEIHGTTPGGVYDYAYDQYGNRTGAAVAGQWHPTAVNPATNRLSDATYDPRGNQLQRGTMAATYDGFDMVTAYRFDFGNEQEFVYTASDERIGVRRGNKWTWSFRDGSNKVLRQFESSAAQPDGAWLWVEDFVYRNGALLASERAPEQGGRRHYHLDHLGTPRLVTGANGERLSQHDYLPFGEERTSVTQNLARGHRETPLRFTGHERDYEHAQPNDSSVHIDYMHARYYTAEGGRFLSVDPGKDWDPRQPQSWNMYSYVRNNPLNMTDPDGREGVAAAVGAFIGFVGGAVVEVHNQGWGGTAPIDYRRVGRAAVGGAAAGFITGACTCPAAAGGAAGGIIGGTVTRTLNGEQLKDAEITAVAADAVGGAVGAAVGKAVGTKLTATSAEKLQLKAAALRAESPAKNQGLGADKGVQQQIKAATLVGQQTGDAVTGTPTGIAQSEAQKKLEQKERQ